MSNAERALGSTAEPVPEACARYLLGQLLEPWAEDLVSRADIVPGAVVLDVSTGPGAVARRAARATGVRGQVSAMDISRGMVELACSYRAESSAAPITYRVGPGDDTGQPDSTIDSVTCQQGLQFFPDPAAAVREMCRVVRPGGTITVSTWSAEKPLGLLGPIVQTLAAQRLPEPYPQAFDTSSHAKASEELRRLFEEPCLGEAQLETVTLVAEWRTPDEAASTILGTPFGPLVTALDQATQDAVRADLLRRLDAPPQGPVRVVTTAHVVHARRLLTLG